MKKRIARIPVLILFICFSLSPFVVFGQTETCDNPPNSIINSTLEPNDPTTGGDMNTNNQKTINGWYVSDGTPTISIGSTPPGGGDNGVWMWSYGGNGEKMYTCYNFVQGETYSVCLWVMNTNGAADGNLEVVAANGLTTSNEVPTSSQTIDNSFTNNQSWTQLHYTFTANGDYSQLHIYPFKADPASVPAEQYELKVDLIEVSLVEDPSFTLTDFCEGESNSATITGATGGVFTIESPTGDGATIDATTGEISNGIAGTTYTIKYTVGGDCGASETNDVTIYKKPTFTTSTTNPSCGNNDGEIVITPDAGFTITDYSIDNGATTQSGGTFSNLEAGSFDIVITDNNGCEGKGTENLSNTNGFNLTVDNSTDVSCFGEADGTAEVSASGGTTPYTYNWSPEGGTNATATDLPAGTYTVTATDDASCTEEIQITIAEPDSIVIDETITNTDCGADNGEIALTVTGGAGNYTYAWNPNVSTSDQATDLAVGSYEVTVTDDDGCSRTVSYNVIQGNSFYIETIPEDSTTVLQGESVDLNLIVEPGIEVEDIIWMPAEGLSCWDCKNPTAKPQEETAYIVTVTDTSGCTSADTVIVNVIKPCADIFVPNTFSPNKDGLNDRQCVHGECIVSLDFTIFNRWGETIFTTGDQEECWDGTYKGKSVQSGTYVYKLKATLEDGTKVEDTGNITVTR